MSDTGWNQQVCIRALFLREQEKYEEEQFAKFQFIDEISSSKPGDAPHIESKWP